MYGTTKHNVSLVGVWFIDLLHKIFFILIVRLFSLNWRAERIIEIKMFALSLSMLTRVLWLFFSLYV